MTARDEHRRQPLQRVPPHDFATERHLLGAAMLNQQAAQTVADTDPAAFYWGSHQTIAHTVQRLVAEGAVVDAGTIAAQLRLDGQLDGIRSPKSEPGGASYLVTLTAAAPNTSTSPKLAQVLVELWHKRRVLALASEVVEAVYSGLDTAGLVARMHEAAQAQIANGRSTWDVVNLADTLAGEGERLEPTVLARTDGVSLIYPGRIHALNAESESGKSWVALLACKQQIDASAHVLYIDFEDSPESVTERLLALGAAPDLLLDRFHYIRPDDPIDEAARVRVTEALEAWHPTLVVIDGVTEAMVGSGWSITDNDDIAQFLAALPRLIERAGGAVLLIDHVTKDKEHRGRFAIGGQHKLAGVTGAAYSLDVVKPFGRGLHGVARVTVTKDKHGQVRAVAAGGKHAGEFHLDATGDHPRADIIPPVLHDPDAPWRPTIVMEKVSRELEQLAEPAGANGLAAVIGGKKELVLKALKMLIEEGYVERQKAGRGYAHRSIKPYRQDDDPLIERPDPPRDWTADRDDDWRQGEF